MNLWVEINVSSACELHNNDKTYQKLDLLVLFLGLKELLKLSAILFNLRSHIGIGRGIVAWLPLENLVNI